MSKKIAKKPLPLPYSFIILYDYFLNLIVHTTDGHPRKTRRTTRDDA